MRAGFAQVDITPPPGEEMTGYGYYLNRRATGAVDALLARAVALDDGSSRAAVVQLDVIGLPGDLVESIRTEAQERCGIAPEALLLHCTHTHSGPSTASLEGCGAASDYYPPQLAALVVECVEAALADLRDVDEARRLDVEFADGFAYNRVGGDEVDRRVRGLEVRTAGASPIVVVTYACHPVTLGRNTEYSADYPGYAIRELNAYGLRALYLNGSCGDINPLTHACAWGSGTVETLRIYGRDLAAVVRAGLRQAKPLQLGQLNCVSRRVPLEHVVPDPDELRGGLVELQKHLGIEPEDGPARVNAVWHRSMLEFLDSGGLDEAMKAEIQAIACGDVVFVGLSGEVFTRLGAIVRNGAKDRHVLMAATSNALRGYIATPEDIEGNGYASLDAARIYGMAGLTPQGGVKWAQGGAEVVRQAAGPQ